MPGPSGRPLTTNRSAAIVIEIEPEAAGAGAFEQRSSFSAPNECVKVMPDCGVASSKRMAPAAVGWASAKPAAKQKTETNDAFS